VRVTASIVALVLCGVLAAGAGAYESTNPDGASSGHGDTVKRARIPHLDGSGRATVVEIDPTVPGAKDFVESAREPVPKRGELIVPPKTSPEPSPGVR